ncbi:protein kinase domain-containing protein [Phthorimaea operculella]|nr:protein kinase domain-containing protein [Phthorimaea operculella]
MKQRVAPGPQEAAQRIPVAGLLQTRLPRAQDAVLLQTRKRWRVALKKLPNVFQSLVSSKRVFRELKMLCFFKHENVLSALDILQPPSLDFFQEIYVITELLQSDLHKIIVSPQHLSADHIKVFLYQILRGALPAEVNTGLPCLLLGSITIRMGTGLPLRSETAATKPRAPHYLH